MMDARLLHRSAVAVVAIALITSAALARAATSATEELERRIEERDATIADLLRRVEALEAKLSRNPDATASRTSPSVGVAAVPGQVVNPAAAPATAVEEEQLNRALERALVREGALVLPPGIYEIEPRLTYTHRATDALQIVTIGGVPQVAQRNRQRDTLETALGLRVGLPWTSQLDVKVPYVFSEERSATGGIGENRDQSGIGDVEIGLTKQLTAGRRGAHGLLATVNYKSTTGSSSLTDPLAPGTGFPGLQAALTAVKRQDPMVFYGTLSHTFNLERTRGGSRVNPGDVTGLKLGTILAANPDTSLRFAFEANRLTNTTLNGSTVAGSDITTALLEFGVATVLSPRSLLDFRVAIGLTPSSPNFRLGLALPIRF